MKFAAAGWLWALAILPFVYFFFSVDEKTRREQFGRFIDPRLWGAVAPEVDFPARLKKARVWVAAAFFLVFAMARPQWGSHEEVVQVGGLDVVFLLDVSNSMEVEDVVPSRLKKAKHLVKSIVERLEGDRVAIIPFAASNYVACPLTTDLDYVMDIVQGLSPKLIQSQGTDIGSALDTGVRALQRGAEQANSDAAAGSQVVILISDGEDHENQAVTMAEKLKAAGVRFYVFGVGTEKGGPIPLRDDNGNLMGYKKDRAGTVVISAFRPTELTQLAAIGGGRYWNATPAEIELEELIKDLGTLSRSDYAERRYLVYEERFQIPLAIALLLIFWELSLPVRKRLRLGDSEAAAVGIFLFLFFPLTPAARAASVETYLENEKGVQAFKDGKTDEAKKFFGTAQSQAPDLPQLDFNQGVVRLKEGDADSAAQSFSEAARGALGRGDDSLAGRSLYNLGVVQTKKGALPQAVKSYLAALDSAKKSGDETLEKDIRKNLELLVQEKKKQQQQKKQDKKDDQSKNDQNENKDQQKKDSKDQENKDKKKNDDQQQPKSYKQSSPEDRKRQFRSLKFSKEDADRVMNELKDKEKELQQRLRKQNARVQTNSKDW